MNTVVSNPFLQIPSSHLQFSISIYLILLILGRWNYIWRRVGSWSLSKRDVNIWWYQIFFSKFRQVFFTSNFPFQYIKYWILLILERGNYTYMEENRFVKRDLCPRRTWIYSGIKPFLQIPSSFLHLQFSQFNIFEYC